MKKYVILFIGMLGFSGANHATISLIANGLVYDSAQNITWMQDANLVKTACDASTANVAGAEKDLWDAFAAIQPNLNASSTSGRTPVEICNQSGKLNHYEAQLWLVVLNLQDYLGQDDWRLPNTQQPDPSCENQVNIGGGNPLQGSGAHCDGSELGHLFHIAVPDGLGNFYHGEDGVFCSPNCFSQTGDFMNTESAKYWSGTIYANNANSAWRFDTQDGTQLTAQRLSQVRFIWPVRDGITPIAENDFVITVTTDNPGTSNDTQFTISKNPFVSGYNYNVDCNDDGISEAMAVTGDYTCNYNFAGEYTIRIQDNTGLKTGFPAIYFDNADEKKLITVEQWGKGKWRSMRFAFRGASNLTIPASDIPDFSEVTSMYAMFADATYANPDTRYWDVSAVENMGFMFQDAASAKPNTSQWDTSAVTYMYRMFDGAISANPDVSGWNVSNVTVMALIFRNVTLSTTHYNALLESWSTQTVQAGLEFHGGNSTYCAIDAHSNFAALMDAGWTIPDGGVDPLCGNCTNDSEVNIQDVICTINIILNNP